MFPSVVWVLYVLWIFHKIRQFVSLLWTISVHFLLNSLSECDVDDGSSSCCCWTDSEIAATVLGLDLEEYSLKDTLMGYKAGKGKRHISTVSRLNQALERHGRISVKNCSSLFDSSCQDFVVESKRSLSSSDEDILQSLITKALLTTSWVNSRNWIFFPFFSFRVTSSPSWNWY